MRKLILLATALVTLGACTATYDVTGPYGPHAPNYRAKFLKDGFNLKVTHENWQFKPDLDVVMARCRDSVHRYAPEIAATKDREIQPIDDSKISMSYNRNHNTGSSTCTATYAVAYK